MKKKLFIIFLLLITIKAQGTVIRGLLIDAKTKAQIPYVNVYFNTHCGTTTDINGDFVLYTKSISVNDTLWISCVGYYRKFILYKDLTFNGINKIYLTPVVYSLDTSKISSTRITPFQLLRDAFKKIKVNCKDSLHFYKATYYEHINNYDPVKNWHSRTLNCAVIVEDPGYSKLHSSLFGIIENVYILGINKSEDSITRVFMDDPNYLMWTMENNYYRYSCDYFNSPRTYNYKIKSTYYDSIIQKNMIEISITPKCPKKDFVYSEVFLSSSDHKIFKIHIFIKSEGTPDSTKIKKKSYYKFLDSDIIVIYKPDLNKKMELSYIKYEFGDGSFYYEKNQPITTSKRTMEYKVIGEAENGTELIKGVRKMDNKTTIYDQKVNNSKDFWLENNVIIKE